MKRCWLVPVAVLMAVSACTGSSESVADVPASASSTEAAEESGSAVTTGPAPAFPVALPPIPLANSGAHNRLPDLVTAKSVDLAPLGTFVVAREGAGIPRPTANGQAARLEIPIYETPFGPPRALLDVNEIDGVNLPVSLINWSDNTGVLVMRVIAGGPDDDWLIVQAPTRPHNQFVWVRRNDFDFGHTSMRIEIDLANGGGLTLYDAGAQMLFSEIVHGRDGRPTPTHLTYVERGIRGVSVSPAYGTAILSMASYSEALSTFGGGIPSNFLHGTNQPQLMGQRVSSGEIRVPNEILDELIEVISPGTPVLLFNSSLDDENKEAILERTLSPADTLSFVEGTPAATDGTTFVTPQLWRRCGDESLGQLVCRMGIPAEVGRYPFLQAKPDAGRFVEEVGGNVIAVYDVPGGEPRMLVHETPEAYVGSFRMPLRNPTHKGAPLVLWPLEVTPDGRWIRVAAPVRPQRQSVWVRAQDFEFGWTDNRIEIDIAGEGKLTLFDGDTEVVSNLIVSGRESRPTTLGATYVDQVLDGPRLSPAYGPYVITYPLFSDVFPTFGGGLPNQAIHGTNQPELMGQQVSSGKIRLPNEIGSFIAEFPGGMIGARVVIFDSCGIGAEAAMALQEQGPWTPAHTTDPDDKSLEVGVPLF